MISQICSSLSAFNRCDYYFTDVMNAKLSNALGGRALELQFPIGACVYNDGLVVCNSGDNKVLHFQYKNDGSISNKTYIQVSRSPWYSHETWILKLITICQSPKAILICYLLHHLKVILTLRIFILDFFTAHIVTNKESESVYCYHHTIHVFFD